MVDAPWLSPRENSGAFFIFGNWELGIGNGELGMENCDLLLIILRVPASPRPRVPPSPVPNPQPPAYSPSPLDGTTSGKGRLMM
jgi:hypothetical protein